MLKLIILATGLAATAYPAASAVKIPGDVEKFVTKREGCDHFRGEIPAPEARDRMREVNREISRLCKGTDTSLSKLKKKYAGNAAVMARLNEFEADIEADLPVTKAKPGRPAAEK